MCSYFSPSEHLHIEAVLRIFLMHAHSGRRHCPALYLPLSPRVVPTRLLEALACFIRTRWRPRYSSTPVRPLTPPARSPGTERCADRAQKSLGLVGGSPNYAPVDGFVPPEATARTYQYSPDGRLFAVAVPSGSAVFSLACTTAD
jgi:hypothetical protein